MERGASPAPGTSNSWIFWKSAPFRRKCPPFPMLQWQCITRVWFLFRLCQSQCQCLPMPKAGASSPELEPSAVQCIALHCIAKAKKRSGKFFFKPLKRKTKKKVTKKEMATRSSKDECGLLWSNGVDFA